MKLKNAHFKVNLIEDGDRIEIEVERLKADFDKGLIIRITDNVIMTCPGDDLADARAKMNKPW